MYNTFKDSDGKWRHHVNITLLELDKRSDLGGSVAAVHMNFLDNEPYRLFLHQIHYSAVLQVVSKLNVPLKPAIFNSVSHQLRFAASAVGQYLPMYIVYKGKQLYST